MSRIFGTLHKPCKHTLIAIILSLRFFDFIILLLTVGITVFYTVKIYGKNEAALYIVIQGKNENWVYPVNQTVMADVPGSLGLTTVEVKDGKARVISSPCANQTCVTSGSVWRRGQWVACLPNAVFVRIESRETKHGQDTELDAMVW